MVILAVTVGAGAGHSEGRELAAELGDPAMPLWPGGAAESRGILERVREDGDGSGVWPGGRDAG